MGKDVLFVCQEPTFLVKSMVKTLDESGYHTIPIQPTMVDLSRIDTFPDIFIIYLEEDIISFEATLKFLKGKMVEDGADRFMFLIGNAQAINNAYNHIPKTLVTAAFTRPVNMQEVIYKLLCLESQMRGICSRIAGKPFRVCHCLVDHDLHLALRIIEYAHYRSFSRCKSYDILHVLR